MAEFIVRETGYPGVIKQEIVDELIRCKDCKWSEEDGRAYLYCRKTGLCRRTEDDFCSHAERREEGEQE